MESMEYDEKYDEKYDFAAGAEFTVSPMQHSGWETGVPTFNTFSQSSISRSVSSMMPSTETNFSDKPFSYATPEKQWAKCRNVFSVVSSFSTFQRRHGPQSPQESDESIACISDGEDDSFSRKVFHFGSNTFSNQCRSEVSQISSGWEKNTKEKRRHSMIPVQTNHSRSQRYSLPGGTLRIHHSPERRPPEPSLHEADARRSRRLPPAKMARLSEDINHNTSPLRPLCKPSRAKRMKTEAHVSEDRRSHSSSKSTHCRSFIILNFFFVVGISFYALKVLNTNCSTFTRFEIDDLKKELKSQVYGQHIATDTIPYLIDKYLSEFGQDKPVQPLVISLHGWTGVGKNHVSRIVSSFFPVTTLNMFLVPLHFAHEDQDQYYAQAIPKWIVGNLSRCHVNFVLFDEMDKASAGVVQGLDSSITDIIVQNVTHTPIIFLLLSNSKGSDINKYVFKALAHHRERNSLTFQEFSPIFDSDKQGWYSSIFRRIDAFVPFLPLEKRHVLQCIKTDITSKGYDVSRMVMSDIVQEMSFFKLESDQEFSQTGCKRVSDKVNLVYSDGD